MYISVDYQAEHDFVYCAVLLFHCFKLQGGSAFPCPVQPLKSACCKVVAFLISPLQSNLICLKNSEMRDSMKSKRANRAEGDEEEEEEEGGKGAAVATTAADSSALAMVRIGAFLSGRAVERYISSAW